MHNSFIFSAADDGDEKVMGEIFSCMYEVLASDQ